MALSTEALGGALVHYLPWPAAQTGTVGVRTNSATYDHVGQADFFIPETVVASKPGKVVFVKESSNAGCGSLDCWQQANVVVIDHEPATGHEYSWYYHLAYDSVPVQLGTYVSAGTKIGVQGNTGYSTGPHLHFMVATGSPPAWTDPTNPNAAPWPTGITGKDFVETTWANLTPNTNKVSQNGTDISVASTGTGSIDVYVHGQDNALYRKQFLNGVAQGGWEPIGGVLTSAPDADAWSTGERHVVVRGITNEVWYQQWNPSIGTGGGWMGFISLGSPGGGATSDPSIVARANGMLDVTVRGADKQLYQKRFYNNAWEAFWTPWGGTLVGGVDSMAWAANHFDVFALATDGNLYHRYFDKSGVWKDWTIFGKPTGGIGSDTAAVCRAYDQCHVFVRGQDRQLYGRNYSANVWGNWYSLQGTLASGPDAVSWGSGHAEVWARHLDNNIYRRTRTSTGSWTAWQNMGSTP